jgi:ABC-type antimicrobial peptide transport system permease subunit
MSARSISTSKVNDVPFRVIGVLPEKGGNQFANEDNQIIVPLTAARIYLRDIRARNGLPGVTAILMQGVDPNASAVIKNDAVGVLRDRHNISYRNEDDFQVFNQADLLQSFGAISAAITVFLSAIAAISLLVGGIGVMNIMLVTVTERTREIGLRKAIAEAARYLIQFLWKDDPHCWERSRGRMARSSGLQPVEAVSAQHLAGYCDAGDGRFGHGRIDRGAVSRLACRAHESD